MIRNNTNSILKPFAGNYHPFNLHRGYTKIAGYTRETATGINAVELQNTYNEPLRGKVYGNSKQETREGYNLYDESTYPLEIGSYGITSSTVKIADEELATGEYTRCNITAISSTISSGGPYVSFKNKVDLVHGNTYTISAKIRANRDITVTATVFPRIECSSSYLVRSNNTKITTEWQDVFATFIYVANTQYSACTFYQQLSNYQIGDYVDICCLQVTEGNLKNYELYGASPSIDYPAEVISVGDLVTEGENVGKYKIDVVNSGKNLFNRDGDLALNYRMGWDGVNLYPDNGYFTTDYIKVKSNTNYTLNIPFTLNYNRISYYDNNKQFISYFNGGVQTITTPSNAAYLKFGQLQNNIDTLMLVEGNISNLGDYEPYRPPQTVTVYLDAPLRAIEVASTDTYNVTSNNKYYVADYVDFASKKVVRNIKSATVSEISATFTDAKENGYYMCNMKNAGKLDEQTINFESSVTNANVTYELDTPTEEDIELEDINVIPNYCKVSVEVEQEPLALEVEYAKMEVE